MAPLPSNLDPQRILIIKPSAIGDVVHALPALNLLRRRWPAAKISWLVTPACAGLLEGHPQLDEVILFQRRRFGNAWRDPKALGGLWRFSRELRQRRFDLVIDLQGLFRSGWMAWKTRAPIRIGPSNARELGGIFYTHRPYVSWDWHAVERYLAVAHALGCPKDEPVEFHFPTNDADRAAVEALVPEGTRYAVLLPGTNWMTKRWPVKHFAACVGPLKQRHGLASVIAGGPGDSKLAEQIPGGINLCGKTSLRQLVALLERAELVIANDSGPMHIAAALGRPLVSPFGPTNPQRTGPYDRLDSVLRVDVPCSPCYSRHCSHQSCLQWLKPDAVLSHADTQMRQRLPLPVIADTAPH
jgi:lipopolysaccharide heptosyltransferase I